MDVYLIKQKSTTGLSIKTQIVLIFNKNSNFSCVTEESPSFALPLHQHKC